MLGLVFFMSSLFPLFSPAWVEVVHGFIAVTVRGLGLGNREGRHE